MTNSTNYGVDSKGITEEIPAPYGADQPLPNKIFAHLISYLFHPLFIPFFVGAYLLYIHPLAFAGFTGEMKFFRIASIFVSTALLPAFSVFLMWRLQLGISSLQLKTQKERIIPYAVSMIFYFWVWYVFKNQPDSPIEIRLFLLGAFLAVCGAWLANIVFKVSMHTTAMGGVLAFFLLLAFRDTAFSGVYLALVILLAGLVTTARLIVSHHTRFEIYAGLLIGALAQLIATWFA